MPTGVWLFAMKNIPHLGLNPQPAAVKFHALTASTMWTAYTSMWKHFFFLENMHSPRLSQKGNTAFNKNLSQDFLFRTPHPNIKRLVTAGGYCWPPTRRELVSLLCKCLLLQYDKQYVAYCNSSQLPWLLVPVTYWGHILYIGPSTSVRI